MPPPATARFRARPSCRTLDKTNMGELTVWQQPKWSGRSSGNSTCGQDGRSWPGRAKTGFRLVAVNRSSTTIQRGKSWLDLQRLVMAECVRSGWAPRSRRWRSGGGRPEWLDRPRTCLSPMMGSRPVPDRLPAVCVARNFSAATSLDGRQRDSASALRSGLSARLGGRAGAQRAATPGLRADPVRV